MIGKSGKKGGKPLQEKFPEIGPPHRKGKRLTGAELAAITLSGPSPDFLKQMSNLYLSPSYPHGRYG